MSRNGKKIIVLAISMIVVGLVFTLGKSYAYFETSIAGSNVILGVGKLIHSLNSDVKLQNGEKKQIDLIVKSNDDIASKYQVYYKSNNDLTGVLVGYSQDSTDLPSGEIEAKGVKNITIVFENNSSNEVSVEIGVRGGLINNSVEDIVLEEGENRVVNALEGVTEEDFVVDTTATASASDIASGKTAWVNGELITGTATFAATRLTGTVTMCTELDGQTSVTKTIVFSKPFSKTPTITASAASSVGQANSTLQVTIKDKSAGGFSVTVFNGQAYNGYNAKTVTLTWIATE